MEELENEFAAIERRAAELTAVVDAKALMQRPSAESWSAAECLRHLIITADSYFTIWEGALARAPKEGRSGEGPFRLDFWGRLLVWMMEPPPKLRLPAPPNFQPVEMGAPERILPDFLERQRRLRTLLQSARGIALDRIRIASPFSGRVRYSVWSSFCLTASHERRHLWQAERAIRVVSLRSIPG